MASTLLTIGLGSVLVYMAVHVRSAARFATWQRDRNRFNPVPQATIDYVEAHWQR